MNRLSDDVTIVAAVLGAVIMLVSLISLVTSLLSLVS